MRRIGSELGLDGAVDPSALCAEGPKFLEVDRNAQLASRNPQRIAIDQSGSNESWDADYRCSRT